MPGFFRVLIWFSFCMAANLFFARRLTGATPAVRSLGAAVMGVLVGSAAFILLFGFLLAPILGN